MAENADVIEAIESGNAERLKELLAADRALGAARDASGVSALMQALYRQRKDMVELLRRARPDLDIFEATSLGRGDLVEEMVIRDPRLANARSADGFTPLHFAAFFGEESVARMLLEHHAERPRAGRSSPSAAVRLRERRAPAGHARLPGSVRRPPSAAA